MPARIPRIAPTRAPIPAAPAAQPIRTPMPMQSRSAARRTPPAPAGSNEDGEAACISRARIPEVIRKLVTLRSAVTTRFRRDFVRSEEHTSELQSRLHLVCRLLLEKKKKNKKPH